MSHHKDGIKKACLGCAEEFTASPKRVFCSSRCRARYYQGHPELMRSREPEVTKVSITVEWARD